MSRFKSFPILSTALALVLLPLDIDSETNKVKMEYRKTWNPLSPAK